MITFCLYKGVKCQILEVLSNFKFRIGLLEEAMKHFKDFPRHGYDPIYEVTEEEISDIWEERTPIEGFKFEVEPIVYLKKMVSGWWKIDGNVPKLVILQFHQNNKMIINKNKINTPTNINNILPHFYSFCKKLRL